MVLSSSLAQTNSTLDSMVAYRNRMMPVKPIPAATQCGKGVNFPWIFCNNNTVCAPGSVIKRINGQNYCCPTNGKSKCVWIGLGVPSTPYPHPQTHNKNTQRFEIAAARARKPAEPAIHRNVVTTTASSSGIGLGGYLLFGAVGYGGYELYKYYKKHKGKK